MALLKRPDEIDTIRFGGEILSAALRAAAAMVAPGVTTRDINREVEGVILAHGGQPSFKGFNGFPAASCVSVNDEVVHGIPSSRTLRDGDIVAIDVGVRYRGLYSDAALSLPVGEISPEAMELLRVTKRALYEGIEAARAGNWVRSISRAVQDMVEMAGFHVVRDLVGHGVGHHVHEEPQVPNFVGPFRGRRLMEGMVVAIEPMVNAGTGKVKTLRDGWTVVTADGGLSAHFEHTVAVTPHGGDILTKGWDTALP
ncbi:type I methionyl aminopeptidase [Candidatus Fermentibacteria bacterium]|nr:type I methionyl aminopeptidase [Candidatus Fermentibacteria bacterium]